MSLLLLGLLAGLAIAECGPTLIQGDALGSDSVVHASIDLDGLSTEAARSAPPGFETAAGTSRPACGASRDMLGVPTDVQRKIDNRGSLGGPRTTCSAFDGCRGGGDYAEKMVSVKLAGASAAGLCGWHGPNASASLGEDACAEAAKKEMCVMNECACATSESWDASGTCGADGGETLGQSRPTIEIAQGKTLLQTGARGFVRAIVDKISTIVTVTQQGPLRSERMACADLSQMNAAEGAVLTAAVLPFTHECGAAAAATTSGPIAGTTDHTALSLAASASRKPDKAAELLLHQDVLGGGRALFGAWPDATFLPTSSYPFNLSKFSGADSRAAGPTTFKPIGAEADAELAFGESTGAANAGDVSLADSTVNSVGLTCGGGGATVWCAEPPQPLAELCVSEDPIEASGSTSNETDFKTATAHSKGEADETDTKNEPAPGFTTDEAGSTTATAHSKIETGIGKTYPTTPKLNIGAYAELAPFEEKIGDPSLEDSFTNATALSEIDAASLLFLHSCAAVLALLLAAFLEPLLRGQVKKKRVEGRSHAAISVPLLSSSRALRVGIVILFFLQGVCGTPAAPPISPPPNPPLSRVHRSMSLLPWPPGTLPDLGRPEPPSSNPLRVGILGTARITLTALVKPARKLQAWVSIVAIASRDNARALAYRTKLGLRGAAVFDSYDALLRSDSIDAIYIPLPAGMHHEWVSAALRLGKHVLCEKPLASNAEEARRLAALARQRNLILMEAVHWGFHPFREAMEHAAALECIGPSRRVIVRSQLAAGTLQQDAAREIRYNRSLAGGAMIDWGGYVFEVATVLSRQVPSAVECASARIWSGDVQIDEAMTGTLRFTSPSVHATWSVGFLGDRLATSATIEGSNCTVDVNSFLTPHWRASSPSIVVTDLHGKPRKLPLSRGQSQSRWSTYDHQLAAFCKAARQPGGHAAKTDEHMMRVAKLIDEAYIAAGMQPRVGLAGIEPTPRLQEQPAAATAACLTSAPGRASPTTRRALLSPPPEPTILNERCARETTMPRTLPNSFGFEPTWRPGLLRREFDDRGFFVVRGAVPAKQVNQLRDAIEEVGRHNLPSYDHPSLRQPYRTKSLIYKSGWSDLAPSSARVSPHALKLHRLFYVALNLLLESAERGGASDVRAAASASLRAAAARFDPSQDYAALVEQVALVEVHNNAVYSGSEFQNPHWDATMQQNAHGRWLFADVPLVAVREHTEAPFEVWPRTQFLPYNTTCAHPDKIVASSAEDRQYYKCFPDIDRVVATLASSLLYTSLGDCVFRNPGTWHRGTANRAPSHVRDMVTVVFLPLGPSLARHGLTRWMWTPAGARRDATPPYRRKGAPSRRKAVTSASRQKQQGGGATLARLSDVVNSTQAAELDAPNVHVRTLETLAPLGKCGLDQSLSPSASETSATSGSYARKPFLFPPGAHLMLVPFNQSTASTVDGGVADGAFAEVVHRKEVHPATRGLFFYRAEGCSGMMLNVGRSLRAWNRLHAAMLLHRSDCKGLVESLLELSAASKLRAWIEGQRRLGCARLFALAHGEWMRERWMAVRHLVGRDALSPLIFRLARQLGFDSVQLLRQPAGTVRAGVHKAPDGGVHPVAMVTSEIWDVRDPRPSHDLERDTAALLARVRRSDGAACTPSADWANCMACKGSLGEVACRPDCLHARQMLPCSAVPAGPQRTSARSMAARWAACELSIAGGNSSCVGKWEAQGAALGANWEYGFSPRETTLCQLSRWKSREICLTADAAARRWEGHPA